MMAIKQSAENERVNRERESENKKMNKNVDNILFDIANAKIKSEKYLSLSMNVMRNCCFQ